MKIFDGKKATRKILKDLAADVKKAKIRPVLAVILVGENEASKLYVKLKKEAAAKIGIEIKEFYFNDQKREEEIIDKIKELNEDEKIHGIIVQLPLPAVFNTERIIETISPQKDVDGFHKENRRLMEKGELPHFLPVLPLAILAAIADAVKNKSPHLMLAPASNLVGEPTVASQMRGEALKRCGDKLAGLKDKNILALVNSEIFGATLKLVLEKEGVLIKYQVRNTCIVLGIEKEIQAADILITVCGCPNLVKGEMVKEGVILIDGGITRYHDGKVVGDVNRKDVENKAAFLTPVPGGIGPLTVALLLRNVFLAAKPAENK